MARTNVDDDWFVDTLRRRAALIRAVQTLPINHEWMADGMALEAWRLAQCYWKDGQRLVPKGVWARAGLEPLLGCDLAEFRKDGIYVRGTADRHDWIYQKTEAARIGGLKRAKSARDAHGRFLTETPATAQPPTSQTLDLSSDQPATLQAPASPPAPAPAPAPALAPAPTAETSVDVSREAKASPPSPRELADTWNTYSSTAQRKIDLKHFKSDSQRWKLAKARLAQEPDLTYWRKVIEHIAASDFCNGDNGRGWVANFDFLVRRDTHMKTMEGTYNGSVESGFGKRMEDYFTEEEKVRFGVT